ncbi:hypothetical protein [Methanobrevibacter sp. DSM 116169]|uniref:hypothetical protein n=1 Tax=Methanobrevibacter sp. DSM 116169 TaxID=3242727 RepID=UPI0038FC220B
MVIVTTPMCKKILEFAGVKNFKINKNPDNEKGDLAILLSESKVKMNSLAIKLNTFDQIKESIIKVSKYSENGKINDGQIKEIFSNYPVAKEWLYPTKEIESLKLKNSKISVKVYSKFLKDIVEDMNFNINNQDPDYIIFPDYLKKTIIEKDESKFVEIPTHKNISKDPIKRGEIRYRLLEKLY